MPNSKDLLAWLFGGDKAPPADGNSPNVDTCKTKLAEDFKKGADQARIDGKARMATADGREPLSDLANHAQSEPSGEDTRADDTDRGSSSEPDKTLQATPPINIEVGESSRWQGLPPMVLVGPSDFDARRVAEKCFECNAAFPPFWDVEAAVAIRPCCGAWTCPGCFYRSCYMRQNELYCRCGGRVAETPDSIRDSLVSFASTEGGKAFGHFILGMNTCGVNTSCMCTRDGTRFWYDSVDLGMFGRDGPEMLGYAASCRYPPACRLLASLHWTGESSLGVEKNPAKALALLHSVEDTGDPTILFALAHYYEKDGNMCNMYRHIKYLKLASDRGHGQARGMLGRRYLGSGLKSRDEIREYFLFATENSAVECAKRYHYFISELYREEGNNAEHVAYLQKAADAGHIEAAYTLGAYYHHGRLVKKNDSKAREYLESASNLGHLVAKDVLRYVDLQLYVVAYGFGFPQRKYTFLFSGDGKVGMMRAQLDRLILPDFDATCSMFYLKTESGTILFDNQMWLDHDLSELDTVYAIPESELDEHQKQQLAQCQIKEGRPKSADASAAAVQPAIADEAKREAGTKGQKKRRKKKKKR